MTRRAVTIVLVAFAVSLDAQFTDWSTPTNVGYPVNTTDSEGAPFLSKDGLSLYFVRSRPNGTGADIYVSHRQSLDGPWETPLNVGSGVNTSAAENNAALSLDEHRLFFSSNRSGGFGGQDLYVSRRHSRRDPVGWQPALNLGSSINTAANEIAPTFFEDEATGIITMYFASDRPGTGSFDIYASTQLPDGSFSPAVLVDELNSTFADQGPHVRQDGLEIVIASNRPGTLGVINLMVSTRPTTSDPWSEPTYLGPTVNGGFSDLAPALSYDGTTLFFVSTANRPGASGSCTGELGPCVPDLYVATRGKLKAPND